MRIGKIITSIICMFLIISTPIVFATSHIPLQPPDLPQTPIGQQAFSGSPFTPASYQTDPALGGNLGGFVYNNAYQDTVRRYSGGYSFGSEISLGEGIIINVADYEPKQIRQSLLEQQDVPVFIYLKGLTPEKAISFLTSEEAAVDPLLGISSNIPPIDFINVLPNLTSSDYNKHVRFSNYIPPTRRDKYSLNNLGYLIVYLKRLENENQTPSDNSIDIDFNAKIFLRLQDAGLFGLSQQDLTLKQFENEESFLKFKEDYSFFSSRGYIRAIRIDQDRVTLQIYNKNLVPLSLYTPSTPTPLTTGVFPGTTITLTKDRPTSQPISFRYTGNPLNDLFQVTLESVSGPSDKAEIQLEVNGRKVVRKIPLGGRLYPGSNWILKQVGNTKTADTLNTNNLEKYSKEFKLNAQQKNQIINLINNNLNPVIVLHVIDLENQLTQERKSITRKIIVDKKGDVLKYDYKIIGQDTADFLENKYCQSMVLLGHVNKDDVACSAIKLYKEIIKNYPTSKQAEQSKRDLKEIYSERLIEFAPCIRELVGTSVAQDSDLCNEFEVDMQELTFFYAELIGDKDAALGRLGAIGGEDYLKDEGTSFELKRVITALDEKPEFTVRLYEDLTKFNEVKFRQGEFLDLGAPVKIKGDSSEYRWRIENVYPSSINLKLCKFEAGKCSQVLGGRYVKTLKLNQRDEVDLEIPMLDTFGRATSPGIKKDVMITVINSLYEAYVTITPGAGRAFVNSNFRVHIPVDPRPFKWTPDQLESQIKSTKDIIKELDSVISKLDSFISTLKKICLGVFAALTIKNSFTGTKNIARKAVADHFKLRCQKEVKEGRTSTHSAFKTIDECLSQYSSEIKSSTDKTEKYMDDINRKIKGKTSDDLANVTDLTSKEEKEICGDFKAYKEASINENSQELVRTYRDCLLNAKIIRDTTLSKDYVKYAQEKADSLGTLKKVQIYDEARKYAAKDRGDKWDEDNPEDVRRIILQLQDTRQNQTKDENVLQGMKLYNTNPGQWEGSAWIETTPTATSPDRIREVSFKGISKYDQYLIESGFVLSDVNKKICEGEIFKARWEDSQGCIVGERLQPSMLQNRIDELKKDPAFKDGRQIFLDKNYHLVPGFSTSFSKQEDCEKAGGVWEISVSALGHVCNPKYHYSTAITNTVSGPVNTAYSTQDLVAKYDGDGLVYCYPTGKGEYVQVLERYPGTKEIRKIRAMNVGSNGVMECGGGDDEYAMGGDETALEANPKKKNEYIRLAPIKRCTRENLPGAVKEGSVVSSVDNKQVKCDLKAIEVLSSIADPKCIDVMDPTDCKWLFNFCDPVMCPMSRCDLGGRVPRRNVVQSGIIGSLLLCTPNFNQGVYLPVCLTGISAGLKNIKSILEGYSNCLEINLKQGKNVGICDYIRSVGICEMVWREAYNLLGISGGVIDWAAGKLQGDPQGGGEYLSFHSSLDNVGESVRVFTQEYKTTYTAQFLSQSTEEIGTQICRLSVNGKLPSIGKILDQITEPENPPQFTAFFDETPYAAPGESPALPTVGFGAQELSSYNVFYHIYAGTGFYQGVYSKPTSFFAPGTETTIQQPIVYSVYLINREEGYSPLYVTFPGDFQQFQGRIDSGKYAQQSVQKIGRKGYKQICVNINGVEQCGFGRVSTSFGLNELKDQISAKEAEREIKSAQECAPNQQGSQDYSAVKLSALSGTQLGAGSGALGILTPQAGAIGTGIVTSNIVQTNLFTTGIVRVCSINEPTQESGRWKRVGTCGKDNAGKSRGECWIDVNSVKIDDLKLKNEFRSELQKRADPKIQIITSERARDALDILNAQRDEILNSIRSLVQKAKKIQTRPVRVVKPIVPSVPLTPTGTPTEEPKGGYTATTTNGKEFEKELSTYIEEIANANGIDPLFVRAIIRIESNWNPKSISCAGAAGIVQLMPHTANDFGISPVLNTVRDPNTGAEVSYCIDGLKTCRDKVPPDGVCERTSDGKKTDNAYARALKAYAQNKIDREGFEALSNEDNRFDNKKAVEALISTLVRYRVVLERKGLPMPISYDNLAASYNGGPGNVRADNNYNTKDQYNYVATMNKYYNKLKTAANLAVAGLPEWPVSNPIITSCYGKRNVGDEFHDGIDFRSPVGTPIKSVGSGKVYKTCAAPCKGFGNSVVIETGGIFVAYNHLSEINVNKNDNINAGAVIGKSGATGSVTAPHLDLKVYTSEADIHGKDTGVDPLKYLPRGAYTFANSADSCVEEIAELRNAGNRVNNVV
ncbi:peptidoglycan DD-metalloendopeptidase family protein [Candidatus Woesearchaeota archaeon]|nr:peptidoglycan DD-metalloendopeptidase family protein [Candidatus Woesearchaeota archaeon]